MHHHQHRHFPRIVVVVSFLKLQQNWEPNDLLERIWPETSIWEDLEKKKRKDSNYYDRSINMHMGVYRWASSTSAKHRNDTGL
jgi:hypothetical protein